MTACVNNQNENKGGVSHKVLRSVVAGVMAVSMVPSIALADVAEPATEIAPLAATGQDAFAAGTVTAAVDGNGKQLTVKDGAVELVATGEAQEVIPTELTLENGDKIDLTEKLESGANRYTFSNNEQTDVDSYTVTITDGKNAGWKNETFKINIVHASLSGAFAYEGDDMSDKTFVWDGIAADIHFAIGDTALEQGTHYDVTYLGMGVEGSESAPTKAGQYIARLKGKGMFKDATVDVPFTIEKLDISGLELTVPDIAKNGSIAPVWTNADGETLNNIAAETTSKVTGPSGNYSVKGDYSVAYSTEGSDNLTGTKSASFKVVDKVAGYFAYGSTEITSDGKDLDTFNTAEKNGFDPANITVGETDDTDLLPSSKYTVKVTKDGKEVKSYTEPGVYVGVIEVVTNSGTYDIAGKRTFTFRVVDGTFASADVFVNFNGEITSTISKDYDGTDVIDSTAITVKSGDKVLKEGTDYEVTWYADDTNGSNTVEDKDKPVTEVVNAGDYLLEVKGLTYKGTDVVDVTVKQIRPTFVRVAGLKTVYVTASATKSGLPYTGSEITPVIEYTTTTKTGISALTDGVEWKTLPAENYKLVIANSDDPSITDMVEAGTYDIKLTNVDPEIDNFDLQDVDDAGKVLAQQGTPGKVNVIDDTLFSDVKAADWFATEVTTAAHLNYVNGYPGNVFMPQQNMTRAEAIKVLANMAGATSFTADQKTEYTQKADDAFADVSSTDWFAAEVGWANSLGLVSGNGDGTFAPNDKITREQFAIMLSNYCKTFDEYTAADADVLAGYADVDGVSSWATDAVAWAVQNKLMGANTTLNATDNVTRAEACKMVVNYTA